MKIATSALALFAAVSPLAAAQGSFNEITADSLSVQDGAAQSLEQIAITSDVAAPDEDVVILYASESSDLPVSIIRHIDRNQLIVLGPRHWSSSCRLRRCK